MFRDTDDMAEFLGDDAKLISASVDSPDNQIFALNIFSGRLLLHKGGALPVLGDRISLAQCGEYRSIKYRKSLLAATLAPAGDLENVLFINGSSNYYHFLTFNFCALFFLRALPQERAVVLAMQAGFPASMKDLLADMVPTFAGDRPVELRYFGDGQYNVRNIIYALPTRNASVNRTGSHFVVPYVLERMKRQGRAAPETPAKIFVRREGGVTGRNLINQAEIEALLARRGYVSVNPGVLPAEDQIVLFAQATHIVGVEGAAMANMLFAVRAVDVVLITSPEAAVDTFFSSIAKTSAYTFRMIAGELAPGASVARSTDYSLPIELLKGVIGP